MTAFYPTVVLGDQRQSTMELVEVGPTVGSTSSRGRPCGHPEVSMTRELLLLDIDEGRFAVETCSVREVLRAAALFPLPEYPELVEGGLNLRGSIVPVVDGRAILDRPRRPMRPADHMIVLSDQTHVIAIHVDHAVTLTEIADQQLTEQCVPGRFVAQVVNTQHGPASILDVGQLIAACNPLASTSSAVSTS